MTDTPAQPDPADPRVGLNGPDGLNARLCRAVGVNDETNQGFRLTVLGGELPQLEIFAVPEVVAADGQTTDPWSQPLAQALVGTSCIVLPGADPTQYPATTRPLMLPDSVSTEVRRQAHLAEMLDLLLDVVNGAYLSMDDRAVLSSRMREVTQAMRSEVTRAAWAASVSAAAAAEVDALENGDVAEFEDVRDPDPEVEQ